MKGPRSRLKPHPLQIPVHPSEPAVDSAALPTGTGPAAPAAQPTGRQDFSRSLYYNGPSPAGLSARWSFKPEGTLFFGIPVIAGKRIFAAGCQADLGAYTGLLTCLDFDTGKPIWQTTQNGNEPLRPFFSSPAVTGDGKYVLIGQGLHQDRDCSLLCFDAATGRQVWAVKTPLHVESSPAIFGDLAVVGAGAVEGEDGKAVGDPGFVLAAGGAALPAKDQVAQALDKASTPQERHLLEWCLREITS